MSRRGPAPTDRRPGALARAAAALLIASAVASCTGVLSLDGYASASEALCGMLDGCYVGAAITGCRDHVDARLDASADLPVSTQWLTALGAEGCLDNCTAARSCLDIEPVCIATIGVACSVKEECCSFTKGAVDCVRERCCYTDGQRCGASEECCGTTCMDGFCGGVLCREAGVACDLDDQCCSRSCRGNACTDTICSPNGFECGDGAECCSLFCNASGRCAEPACGREGAPCASAGDCCAELVCHALGAKSFCSPGECTPREIDCGSDSQCCTGFCDPVYRVCADGCREAGSECEVDGQCCTGTCDPGSRTCADGCSVAYCDADADCCSNRCVAHTCAPVCVGTSCNHDVCSIGAPLDPTCTGTADGTCVGKVCTIDPYCCCNAWDSFCVTQAEGACKVDCPSP
jgi:hypothetical protein